MRLPSYWKALSGKTKQCNHCKKIGNFEKLCRIKVPRIAVGQIHLSKAPTVKVLIRNGNHTLGESEAVLDYGADISLADLNFLKKMGLYWLTQTL